MRRLKLATAVIAVVMGSFAVSARAQSSFQVIPFTFDPDNLCDVQSTWVADAGLPDPGSSSNFALFLKKGCPTATVAAAGADIITDLEGQDVSQLTELNFDYRNDGHCGAGAPRFNVVVDGTTYFLGCSGGVHTAVNDDWTHVVFGPVEFAAAGIPLSGTIDDIYLIFDEGTDTPTGGTIATAGEVYLDNFSLNGDEVAAPPSPMTKDECKNGGWMNFQNPVFRNQGQCVSYVVSNRGGNRS